MPPDRLRAFVCIVSVGMIPLAWLTLLFGPEADEGTQQLLNVILGAVLTIGYANIIGFLTGGSVQGERQVNTIERLATQVQPPPTPGTATVTAAPDVDIAVRDAEPQP